jgi:hypothetical protein
VTVEADREVLQVAQAVIQEMRSAVQSGRKHWFLAMMEAVRAWPLPHEVTAGRHYRYLIAGEAFDWLLLAERLSEEIEDLVPADELEDLLFHERLPLEMDAEEFRAQLGAKYRAHLNFVYGVRVETALQLAVHGEVHKERLSRIWENGHMDDEAFARIYGGTRAQMLAAYRQKLGQPATDELSLCDLNEFTYWLFRYRLANCDPARVASDTRKGLAFIQRMEPRRGRGEPA